jgi:ribonuclease T2
MPRTPRFTTLTALILSLAVLTFVACHAPASSAPQTFTSQSTTTEASQPDAESGRRDSRRHNSQQANDTPGAFDFYLLTLSWSPEFCYSHPTAAECAAHPAFVLHGLWPQNTDGSYPENCSNAPGPVDPGQYSDIFPDAGLLAHEWQTHGTCSGLAPDAYFQLARRAFRSVHIPQQFASVSQQINLAPDAILTDFAQSNPSIPTTDMALSCGNNFLTAVQVCLNKSLNATSCSSVKTCRANVVKVTPPGATRN